MISRPGWPDGWISRLKWNMALLSAGHRQEFEMTKGQFALGCGACADHGLDRREDGGDAMMAEPFVARRGGRRAVRHALRRWVPYSC